MSVYVANYAEILGMGRRSPELFRLLCRQLTAYLHDRRLLDTAQAVDRRLILTQLDMGTISSFLVCRPTIANPVVGHCAARIYQDEDAIYLSIEDLRVQAITNHDERYAGVRLWQLRQSLLQYIFIHWICYNERISPPREVVMQYAADSEPISRFAVQADGLKLISDKT